MLDYYDIESTQAAIIPSISRDAGCRGGSTAELKET